MLGSNKAAGTRVLRGASAQLPLFIIAADSPLLPLGNSQPPASPTTPSTHLQKLLGVCMHTCLSLCASKSLIRRLKVLPGPSKALSHLKQGTVLALGQVSSPHTCSKSWGGHAGTLSCSPSCEPRQHLEAQSSRHAIRV